MKDFVARLEEWVGLGLQLLALLGILLGLLFVFVLLGRLIRSLWQVTARRRIAVLPFEGSDTAAVVGQLLPQRWAEIEREWTTLVQQISDERPRELTAHEGLVPHERSDSDGQEALASVVEAPSVSSASRAALGAAPRMQADSVPDEEQFVLLSEETIEKDLPTIALGGVSVSPNVIFDAIRRLAAVGARRSVRGAVHEFGDTIRMTVVLKLDKNHERAVVVRALKDRSDLLGAIDDLAFAAAKRRVTVSTTANRWASYAASLEGFRDQLRFERSARSEDRERAIQKYAASITAEPTNPIAQYNYASLLYSRYMEIDMKAAAEHFELAVAHSDDRLVSALALAGVAMAHCQLTNRFSYPVPNYIPRADEASEEAIELGGALEEAWFARGFSLQEAGRLEEALAAYGRAYSLPGSTAEERRLRSFALNNAAWIHLSRLNDLERASRLLKQAIALYPNRMSHSNLAEIDRREGDLDGAMANLHRALAIDPRYVNGMNELAMLYVDKAAKERGREEEWLAQADAMHHRALELVPPEATNQRRSVTQAMERRLGENGFPTSDPSIHATNA